VFKIQDPSLRNIAVRVNSSAGNMDHLVIFSAGNNDTWVIFSAGNNDTWVIFPEFLPVPVLEHNVDIST
jgi:hypothetical protein